MAQKAISWYQGAPLLKQAAAHRHSGTRGKGSTLRYPAISRSTRATLARRVPCRTKRNSCECNSSGPETPHLQRGALDLYPNLEAGANGRCGVVVKEGLFAGLLIAPVVRRIGQTAPSPHRPASVHQR
jgi:hypothetical protein